MHENVETMQLEEVETEPSEEGKAQSFIVWAQISQRSSQISQRSGPNLSEIGPNLSEISNLLFYTMFFTLSDPGRNL